ncbi:dihydrodipicolinate synthetase [Macrolepiota fuliginosa MF-IS2]|uniref:Dihydrodipicolinate synthetase n=1 Tax=Macrolepiota fuliginosa MF-IS2 TaxID=1400762 RepID=A0A9P5XSG1_9AGAR|nr:dihydrodipicolinate synthetase [Macrolepiota fuliginosa MF-IS2]
MATNGVNGINGHQSVVRPLKPGVFAPIPTFFLPDTEDLDIPSFESHVALVAQAGVGPVVTGSMGEAIHLSPAERATLVQTARRVLDDIGLTNVPVIAGTGAGSTRETLELTKQAAAAGADYGLVIASGYFAGALAGNREALKAYWVEISKKSPIPVMIYNYPGASGGIDLDSDMITDLARECPNICGVKLTCGNVGKLTRIADEVSQASFTANHPRQNASAPFLVLGGFIDFLTPSHFANAHGAITGLANVAPRSIAKLFQLSEAARGDLSLLPEAQRVQGIVARADFTIAKASIAGTKYLLERLHGYGGLPRKPLPPISATAATALWEHPHTQDLVKLERELSGKVVA